MTVPFTLRSFIGLALFILLLLSPIWWVRHSGGVGKDQKPDLTGDWYGTVRVTEYVAGIGRSQPMKKEGTLSLHLDMYDGVVGKYRGDGHLQIQGDRSRPVHVTDLSMNAWFGSEQAKAEKGSLRVEGTISGDFEVPGPADDARVVEGSASATRVRFVTADDSVGYNFEVDLHRDDPGAQRTPN